MVCYNDGLLHDIDSELDARHESSSGAVLHPCICELRDLQIVGTGLEGRKMGEAGSRVLGQPSAPRRSPRRVPGKRMLIR